MQLASVNYLSQMAAPAGNYNPGGQVLPNVLGSFMQGAQPTMGAIGRARQAEAGYGQPMTPQQTRQQNALATFGGPTRAAAAAVNGAPEADEPATPAALSLAASAQGLHETEQNAALQEYLANGGVNLDPATTAWCAAFVNATLSQSGMEGTGKLNARSFLDWGQAVDAPEVGDIAVFSRGDPNGWQGHVGFFHGYNDDGTINVLGGNQGDAVNIRPYSADRLLGFRRGSAPVEQRGRAPALPEGFDPRSAEAPRERWTPPQGGMDMASLYNLLGVSIR